jgi:hypothetical protein
LASSICRCSARLRGATVERIRGETAGVPLDAFEADWRKISQRISRTIRLIWYHELGGGGVAAPSKVLSPATSIPPHNVAEIWTSAPTGTSASATTAVAQHAGAQRGCSRRD